MPRGEASWLDKTVEFHIGGDVIIVGLHISDCLPGYHIDNRVRNQELAMLV